MQKLELDHYEHGPNRKAVAKEALASKAKYVLDMAFFDSSWSIFHQLNEFLNEILKRWESA